MPQAMIARVTCPSCQNQFQTPVEQILDVRDDPSAKMRVLNGLLNIAACPHCQAQGALNLPFLYHDPEKELALIYMPMEAGRDDLERQQAIGRLTSTVINGLPPEQRRGYLLQPQVFLTMENIANRILEADGITPEMVEERKAKADLLGRMLDATSDEVLEAIVKENDARIDDDLFGMLAMNLEMAQAIGQAAAVQRLLAVHDKLMELSSAGQAIRARTETVEALRAEPTREKLLDLLVKAPDEEAREMLILYGRPLLDYPFFQLLTAQIEAASAKAEKERLTALRKEILDTRDRLDDQARAVFEERAGLLRDLLLSDDPEKLARQRAMELDQAFSTVLTTSLEDAKAEGNQEMAKSLEGIWHLVLKLMEETLPPEVRFVNRLMNAEDEAEIDRMLQENRRMVTQRLADWLERIASRIQEESPAEVVEHLKLVQDKIKKMVETASP